MMKKLGLYLLLLFVHLSSARAQYFNNKYTLSSPATYANNIIRTDSFIYLSGVVTPDDSIYQGKFYISKFDFSGNLKEYKYFELDSLSSYQPSSHTLVIHNNSVSLCGGLGVNGTSTAAFAANIDIESLGISLSKYPDTTQMRLFFQSSVILASGSRIYLGAYETSAYHVGYYIIKTDSIGTEQVRRYCPLTTLWQEPAKIILLRNGNLLIGSQKGNYLQGSICSSYTQLIEIDTLGNQIKYWEDNIDSAAGRCFSPSGIVELPNTDRIYTSSYLDSCEVLTNIFTTWTFQRGYIVRIDTSNNKIWEITLGTSSTATIINQMKQLSDGNFLAVGNVADTMLDPTNPFQAGWIIKFDQHGHVIWQHQYYNSFDFNYLYDFVELDNGDIVACGQCVDHSLPSHSQQAWLIRIDSNGCVSAGSCTSAIHDVKNEMGVIVYPNPASFQFNIDISNAEGTDIIFSLFDLTGKEMLTRKLSQPNARLDCSLFAEGIYFWVVTSGGENQKTGKLIIR